MIINTDLFDALSEQARVSPRLRMNYDLRNTPDDHSQRMLNALEPGTAMPIHRHRNSSETVVVLRGKVKWFFYDNQGCVTDSIVVEAGGETCGLSIPIGQWHKLDCLKTGSIVLTVKDGAWSPLDKEDTLCI